MKRRPGKHSWLQPDSSQPSETSAEQVLHYRWTILSILAPLCHVRRLPVGGVGVAQWLERWSLTGELSLIYTWSMVDMWRLRGLGVRYGSTNQANSAFHPFGVDKWVAIYVITWITEVETILAAWPTSWRPPGADRLAPRGTKVNSRIW